MISVVSVLFAILALAGGTRVHFWLFDKVELREVGTRKNAVTNLALGKLN